MTGSFDPEAVARAVLFEGYMLYPYRESALKNRGTSPFGLLSPAPARNSAGCEFLVLTRGPDARIAGRLRFLRADLGSREDPRDHPFELALAPGERRFEFENDGLVSAVGVNITEDAANCCKVAVEVTNASPAGAADRAMVSTQVLLYAHAASFATARTHAVALREYAESCRSDGLWPILLGDTGRDDVLLCAAIVVDDHPAIAPESPGDMFDATEIDELLALRVRTLAPAEREEIDSGDARVRAMVDRADALDDDQIRRLHGALRAPAATPALRAGDRVRLRPHAGGDVFDIALAGRIATILSIERDFDGRTHVSVTVDDDPGRDLGMDRQTGHRFFFAPDEVERVD